MDARFAVLRHLKALNYKDTKDASHWLSPSLVFRSSLKDFGRKEYLKLFEAVFTAFPDWEITYSEPHIRDGWVQLSLQMEGTHMQDLELNLPGLKPVAATYKKVLLPRQQFSCRVENDAVVEVIPETNPEAGLLGILKQLGVKAPPSWWLKLMWATTKVLRKEPA
jgi:hypothetical protein